MGSGESNPRAKLSDREVELLRELYETDRVKALRDRYWNADTLAEKFEISRRQVYNIVSYRQR